MEPVKPERTQFLLPPATRDILYAENQWYTDHAGERRQFIPLPTLQLEDGRIVSQWQPSAEEKDAINRGQPVTLVLHTFGEPLQPIILAVGGLDLR